MCSKFNAFEIYMVWIYTVQHIYGIKFILSEVTVLYWVSNFSLPNCNNLEGKDPLALDINPLTRPIVRFWYMYSFGDRLWRRPVTPSLTYYVSILLFKPFLCFKCIVSDYAYFWHASKQYFLIHSRKGDKDQNKYSHNFIRFKVNTFPSNNNININFRGGRSANEFR
jgi:hypothetical protein